MKAIQFVIFLTLVYSCKNTNSSETAKNPAIEVDSVEVGKISKQEQIFFYAAVDKLRLRKEPGSKGDVLEQIEEGGTLLFLNEKTDFTEKIKIRDQWQEEPWLKVKSASENIGWVFGGGVTDELPKQDLTKMPYDDCNANFVVNRDEGDLNNCYKKVAKQQLEADARYIKKTDTGYQVTLLSGETRNLVNDNNDQSEENFRQYEYRFYLEKLGYFIFKIDRFEGGGYIMMNDKFGYVSPIYGLPKLSPDFKKIVIVNNGSDSGFEFNGIQLLSVGDEGITTVFEEELESFAPYNPVWIDEKNISFDFLSRASGQKKSQVKAKLSEDENGKWKLTISNRRE
jgi:hypothetical protein